MSYRIWILVCICSLAGSLRGFASGRIMDFRVDADTIELTVDTTAATSYQLQCNSNLVDGAWDNLGDAFVAETNQITLTLPAGESEGCMFRVVVLDGKIIEDIPPTPELPPPPPPVG